MERVLTTRVQTLYAPAATISTANPVLKSGELGTESDTFLQKIGDGATPWNALPYLQQPRGVSLLAPEPGDRVTLFKAERTTTLRAATAVKRGTGTATVELRYASNLLLAGTVAAAATEITSVSNGQSLVLTNQPISAGSFVWLSVTAVAGDVTELSLTLSL